MTTECPLPAQIAVESFLVHGEKFIKWDDESGVGSPVILRVDAKGYFLSWTYQNKQVECLDITSIRDTRIGTFAKVPKNPKIREIFNVENPESNFYSKCLTVVSGPDFVNLTFDNFVAFKENVVKWSKHILNIVIHPFSHNAPRSAFLDKMLVGVCTVLASDAGTFPLISNGFTELWVCVSSFYQMFPADRKRVEAALSACHLPKLKTDMINLEDFNEVVFQQFLAQLCPRPEISQIFDLLKAKAKPFLTRDQLCHFVNKIQRDSRLNEELCPPLQPAQIQSLIEKYEPSNITARKGHLSPEGLILYLSGPENSVLFPDKLLVNQDMTQPLSHYYINSSHNTYLTAGQFSGLSSPEMYRQVLLAGCRCVELDCWKGRPPDEEPIITHGFTMTTEIFFKDVIEAIAESAFKTSPYPLILSFENHVDSPKQQAKMADYCRTIFGDMLLTEPLEKYPLKPGNPLPSPKDLMGKILIKNKKNEAVKENGQAGKRGKGTELSSCEQNTGSESSESGEAVEDDVCENEEEAEMDGEDEGLRKAESDEGTAAQEVRAYEEMSSLVNYIQPRKFDSFDIAKKINKSYSISSFTETKALDLIMKLSGEFLQYNKRQMSRIYPKGTRVDSSNYNPHIFWIIGCQMVALNFQTTDIPMQLNSCLFEFNGRSGYLLKHEFLRRPDKKFDPFTSDHIDTVVSNALSITVISGQFLSERSVKCYVEVELFGLPSDPKRKFRTKMNSEPNSINPYWKDEMPFVFNKILLPDLTSVRIAVFEDSGKFIGHRILPLPAIQPGYRQVCLLSESNQPLTLPSLFLHIEIKDYVPDTLADFSKALTNPIQHASVREQRTPAMKTPTEQPEEVLICPPSPPTLTPTNNPTLTTPHPPTPPSPISHPPLSISPHPPPHLWELEPLNVTELRNHKAFVKLLKKQEKEMKEMERRDAKRTEELTNRHSSLFAQLHASLHRGFLSRSFPNINGEAPGTETVDCTNGPSPMTWKVLELKEKLEKELSSLRAEQLEGVKKKKEQHITEVALPLPPRFPLPHTPWAQPGSVTHTRL
uniref:Phosphoinositide phospholipase C n=1 Tax=Callorhinchus milii TaxID=7868 RepID=A0A4W3K1H2_CALMI